MALRDSFGTSIVLVTHDIEEAIAMSDRVIVLGAARRGWSRTSGSN